VSAYVNLAIGREFYWSVSGKLSRRAVHRMPCGKMAFMKSNGKSELTVTRTDNWVKIDGGQEYARSDEILVNGFVCYVF
jgi:hypothetical protein